MKYLADTHILLWSFLDSKKLSENIRAKLMDENNEIYYSPISLWEISIKYGLKKLFLHGLTPEEFFKELDGSYYICKELNNHDLITTYQLPMHHRDPFDRLLIWESIRNDLVLMSVDTSFEPYIEQGLRIEN